MENEAYRRHHREIDDGGRVATFLVADAIASAPNGVRVIAETSAERKFFMAEIHFDLDAVISIANARVADLLIDFRDNGEPCIGFEDAVRLLFDDGGGGWRNAGDLYRDLMTSEIHVASNRESRVVDFLLRKRHDPLLDTLMKHTTGRIEFHAVEDDDWLHTKLDWVATKQDAT